jgi:hypothetical protein
MRPRTEDIARIAAEAYKVVEDPPPTPGVDKT